MKSRKRQLHAKIKLIFCCLVIIAVTSCFHELKKNDKIVIFTKSYPPPLKYKETGALLNGKKDGLWTTYDSTGHILSQTTFIDGLNIGENRFYEGGILRGETKDSVIGNDTLMTLKKYNENGAVVEEGKYLNRVKTGIWTFYTDNGLTVKKKVLYQKGVPKIIFKDASKTDF
jgi:antitoxin component YwqK of YwqJK toxin-antitoxin module